MARGDNGDDGMWKDIAEEVRRHADRLFKIIGEAYAVLSDPAKVFCLCVADFKEQILLTKRKRSRN